MDPYSLPTLFAFRERLLALDDGDRAGTRIDRLRPVAGARRVALLPGSFNPPTSAHVLLAERALAGGFDAVVYLVPVLAAGKAPSGLIPEDRLLALTGIHEQGIEIAIASHGLYCDQADAAAEAFPGAEIFFLAGSDKLRQIFDGSWYEDREEALGRLFDRAGLLVAPRGEGADSIAELLREPRNRPYADRVSVLRLHPAVGDLSSTRVRGLLWSGADPAGLVPAPVANLCRETRAFCPPSPDTGVDAYGMRVRLLERLWPMREWAERSVSFRALVRRATAAGPQGRRLREALARGADADLVQAAGT